MLRHIIIIEENLQEIKKINILLSGDFSTVIVPTLLKNKEIYIISRKDITPNYNFKNIIQLKLTQDFTYDYYKNLKNAAVFYQAGKKLPVMDICNYVHIEIKTNFKINKNDIIHIRIMPPNNDDFKNIFLLFSQKIAKKNFIINNPDLIKYNEKSFCREFFIQEIMPKKFLYKLGDDTKNLVNWIFKQAQNNKGVILKPDDFYGGYGFKSVLSSPYDRENEDFHKIKNLADANQEKEAKILIADSLSKSITQSEKHCQEKKTDFFLKNILFQEKISHSNIGDFRLLFFQKNDDYTELQGIFRRIPNNPINAANMSQGNSKVTELINMDIAKVIEIFEKDPKKFIKNEKILKNIFVTKRDQEYNINKADLAHFLYFIINNIIPQMNKAHQKNLLSNGVDLMLHKENGQITAKILEANIFNSMGVAQIMSLSFARKKRQEDWFDLGKKYIKLVENCVFVS